ncbi:MAG: FHA domain-containing protein [Burkholderiales bacterium]
MAKLILSLDGRVLNEYPIDKPRIIIGRRAGNDIQIDNLAVSGQHAAIITQGDETVVEDLGSTNGTLVNGSPATRHVLQNGDIVDIGKHRLRYFKEVAATAPAAAEMDYEKTMVIRASPLAKPGGEPVAKPPPPPPVDSPTVMAPAAPQAPQAAIQILSGPNAGKELELVKAITSLGKPKVQVAVITKRPQGYFITHVEGPYPSVNGKPTGAQPHPLQDHDVIEVAGTKLEFFLK